MATMTIKTRTHGDQTFFVPDSGGYVRLESGRNVKSDGRRICTGGDFFGTPIYADAADLPRVARRWWRQYANLARD